MLSDWHNLPVARIVGGLAIAAVLGVLGATLLYRLSIGYMASLDAFLIVLAMLVVAVWDGFFAADFHYSQARWLRGWFLALLIVLALALGILFGAFCW